MSDLWLYIAGAVLGAWGVAHLFPTRNVVNGFGAITPDNRRVITMEWINEGLTLIFIAGVVIVVAVSENGNVSRVVLWLTVVMLNAMSAVSLFTGARVKFLAYRLCPVIFTGASVLILLGISG